MGSSTTVHPGASNRLPAGWDSSGRKLVRPDDSLLDPAQLQGISFVDPAKPGRGTLLCSWQVNPLQSALTGNAFASSTAYPEPLSIPQAVPARSTDGTINLPAVYQAYSPTGQCRAATEIGDDAVWSAAAFTPSITPAAVAANTIAEQSFTCTGLTTLHRIMSVIPAAIQAGLRIVAFRCDAADTLKITWQNTTGGSITPTAGTFTVNTRLTSGGAQSSLFHTLGFWAKAPRRADGAPFTYCAINLYPDIAVVANRGLAAVPVRADNKWRFYVVPWAAFGSAGTFVMGASRFDYINVAEQGAATSMTLTAAMVGGETSATLSAAFSGTNEAYPVRFSSGEVRMVQLTNGSTAISWAPALTQAATTAIVRTTTGLAQGATEAVQVGPVYRDPVGKAFAYIRFDDGCADQYTARQTLSTSFVGQSGVTLATGAYSARDVVAAFGLKANAFILTSCVGKPNGNFMTVAQMRDLQDNYGWDICFQTHANPASLNNLGGRLLGPFGYSWSLNTAGGIASVDTSANTITTNGAHQFLTPSVGQAGLQGQPIEMTGTNLPAPLVTGTPYWPRPTTTAAFTLHPTEADAAANTNAIDLTTTGTPANFGYRYFGSSADNSAFVADVRTGQALMRGWGFKGWRHVALNQGAWDYPMMEAFNTLRASGEVLTVHGTQGSTGSATTTGYAARPGIGFATSGYGFVGGNQLGAPLMDLFTHPQGYASESGTEQAARDFVDSLVMRGAVGGNYHHFFSTEQSLRNLCAYCDQIKLRVDQGVLMTGTMTALQAMMEATIGTGR